MKHSYTQNDLVSYIYNEKTVSERLAIQKALRTDWDLKTSYDELVEGYNALPRIRIRPSLSSVKKLLNYSTNALVETPC